MASKLGFNDLINLAKTNAEIGKKKAQITVFPTISKPKKLDPKQKKLSEGIQKFLKEKEQEEKQKLLEAKAKREHLEDLRSQTKGANRRVGQMLRMTKSANKACIDDAQSCLNDSLAEQGEHQPDEDDYGYVSQSAQQWHKKMMENYKKIPAKVITRKPAAPIPVVQSLGTKKSEGSTSGTTSIRSGSTIPTEEKYIPETKPEKKAPPKKNVPPPMSFQELLKVAEKKKEEPVPVKKQVVQKGDGPEFEYGRPMTAKEKATYMQEKAYRERIEKGLTNATNSDPGVSTPKPENPAKSNSFKIPSKKAKIATQNIPPPPIPSSTSNGKLNADSKMPMKSENIKSQYSPRRYENAPLPAKREREIKEERVESSKVRDIREDKKRRIAHTGYETQTMQSQNSVRDIKIKKEVESGKPRPNGYSQSSSSHNVKELPKAPSTLPKSQREHLDDRSKNYRQNDEPKYTPQTKPKLPPTKEPSRAQPPHPNPHLARDPPSRPPVLNPYLDRDPPSRPPVLNPYMDRDLPQSRPPQRRPPNSAPMHPAERRRPPPQSSQRPANKGRAVIESDEEYDSEMDDFIDDSEVDMQAVSNEISQIFNYRRDKYVDEDSDDECMESNLAQQMAEERRSLLIGIQEDKEEEMKEKMEEQKKRQRLLAMKKKGKR